MARSKYYIIENARHECKKHYCHSYKHYSNLDEHTTQHVEVVPERHLLQLFLALVFHQEVMLLAIRLRFRIFFIYLFVNVLKRFPYLIFHLIHAFLETTHTLAHAFHEFRNFLATKEQQDDNNNNYQLGGAKVAKKQ